MELKTKRVLRIVVAVALFLIIINTALAAVKTFRVKETDFVKVMPSSFDPDQDNVFYNYSSPLDQWGEWQTDYDDAGEYDIDIIASDGQLETTKQIKIIVEQKNQPPILKENKVMLKESQEIDLTTLVEDRENDLLSFQFSPPFNFAGKWATTYEDEGNYIFNFQASDREFTEDFRVEIEVIHTNQPPTILETFFTIGDLIAEELITENLTADNLNNDILNNENNISINSSNSVLQIKEGETLSYGVKTIDYDEDEISYQWYLEGKLISQEENGEYAFPYEYSGEHQLNLVLSDGEKTTERNWDLRIENVNRKPTLELLPITAYENDKISIDVPEKDIDGDILTYEFSAPLDENGEWRTTFEDAGEYDLIVTAFDGELKESANLKIVVLNVDRAPSLNLPAELRAKEGENFLLSIDTEDPDGDQLEINFTNLPENASYDQNTKELAWVPSYDYIKRKSGFFSEILNILRVENHFLEQKGTTIGVTSCGKELCSKAEFKLIVENVNRAPVFENNQVINQVINVTETETLSLSVLAEDPDGDIVRYLYGYPLNQNDGEWDTTYEDSGEYIVNVTATDGFLETVLPVKVIVNNNNRQPSLKVNQEKVIVNEGEEFTLSLQTSDSDENDDLSLVLEELPEGASFDKGIFTWLPSFDTIENNTDSTWNAFLNRHLFLNKKLNKEKTTQWLNFMVSDGEFEVINPVKVIIKNVNQPPELLNILHKTPTTTLSPLEETEDIVVKVNEPLLFKIEARDLDEDSLTYKWDFGFSEEKISGTDAVERLYTTPGNKKVEVKISDGREEITKEFKVKVVEPSQAEQIVNNIEQPPYTFKVYVIKK